MLWRNIASTLFVYILYSVLFELYRNESCYRRWRRCRHDARVSAAWLSPTGSSGCSPSAERVRPAAPPAQVLGWSTHCDPPEQTAAQIGAAIGASPASLSTNMRSLTDAGFLTVCAGQRGRRTQVYLVEDDARELVRASHIASLTEFRDRRLARDRRPAGHLLCEPVACRLRATFTTGWPSASPPSPCPRHEKQTHGR